MLTVAYLANQFPAAVEPYVGEEIEELRRRGVRVIPGSVRRPDAARHGAASAAFDLEILCLQPLRVLTVLRALVLAVRRWERIADLVTRVLVRGKESPKRRVKALLHTWLGAYYAVVLREYGVDHIHVHHGYFGSWIGLAAARLLGVSFSLTLHGSDLLLHSAYLDTKLENCRFCITVSEYNRRYILEHFPAVDPQTIMVSRMGVDMPEHSGSFRAISGSHRPLTLLAVGRLHAVKDHAFLIRACARLRDCGVEFECAIAGEGRERRSLESLILSSGLQDCITLRGHVPRMEMDMLYRRADVVALTSRSEGIPLVLMEAMARGRIVLAPAITGIPEIIIPGKTGFLYAPGNLQDFIGKILSIQKMMCGEHRNAVGRLDWIRQAARAQVRHNFCRRTNLSRFGDRFLLRVASQDVAGQAIAVRDLVGQQLANQNWSPSHENSVLQQI